MSALIPPAVIAETATPALQYIHADALTISEAIARGVVSGTKLSPTEQATADRLMAEPTGIDVGEAQVLAVGKERGLAVVLTERRGRSVARQMGVETRDVVEILFAGTTDDDLLRIRLRRLAGLIDMRVADYEAIQLRVDQRRLQ
jgi:hypothetical protein